MEDKQLPSPDLSSLESQEVLFSPASAKPSGEVLEVVEYWGNTVMEVEHFHSSEKNRGTVTLGIPGKANFLASGMEDLDHFTLAKVSKNGYQIRLTSKMSARLNQGGAIKKVRGGEHRLGSRDLTYIAHGPVHYLMMFIRPAALQLPRTGPKDPLLLILFFSFLSIFIAFNAVIFSIDPKKIKQEEDDVWAIVQVPEKVVKKPEKPVEKKIEIAKVKKPPPPTKEPPKVKKKPKPVKAVKLKEKKKPKPKPKKRKPKVNLEETLKQQTGPKKPKKRRSIKASRRVAGGGNGKSGGARKGKSKISLKGVAGVKNKRASGVNLSKLGLGVGKISSKRGAGAVYTKFRSSAGGAGGGSGSGKKTIGLGGVGSGAKSLGIPGSGSASNQFGTGSGFLGKGKKGLGNTFGGGRKPAKVKIRPGDPLVSGGLTQQEIMNVINANLNRIRHCYEKLLQRAPSASGTIKVSFVVNTSGRVASTKILQAGIRDSSMKRCVTGAVRKMRFPKPRGGASVTVNYPFVFNPL